MVLAEKTHVKKRKNSNSVPKKQCFFFTGLITPVFHTGWFLHISIFKKINAFS